MEKVSGGPIILAIVQDLDGAYTVVESVIPVKTGDAVGFGTMTRPAIGFVKSVLHTTVDSEVHQWVSALPSGGCHKATRVWSLTKM